MIEKKVISSLEQNPDFFLDFLKLWEFIHQKAPNITFSDLPDFTQNILESVTIPFYQKFKRLLFIEKYDSWLKSYSSIVINWPGMGRILFPLRLITYEIVKHKDGLFDFYVDKLLTKEIDGTIDNLFKFIFPKIVNVTFPLSETDLQILKSFQLFQANCSDIFKGATTEDFSTLLKLSSRTILRRLKLINFLQIPIAMHFLDMAQLGYETFLLSHFKPIPNDLKPFTLESTDLIISKFSLFQVPVKKSSIFLEIQDQLEPIIFQQMDRRIQNWNLTSLSSGTDGWKISPSFLYCEPTLQITTTSPAMDISLKPAFDTFRALTPADIKILEFISTTGSLKNKKHLSQTVKVSHPEVNRCLNEYHQKNLIHKIYQFFNIGLDLSITFFISCPKDYNISWIPHLLTFPKVDLWYNEDHDKYILYGYIRIPLNWFKDFSWKVHKLNKEFEELKFYYVSHTPDYSKWGLSLSDTYF